MKPKLVDALSVKTAGITQSVKFGIKASGLHHILGILRNQLYSDKILAVIREYSCNAVDAHTEAECPEKPIRVTLPSVMNPLFKVRDFGPALSDEEIQNVYAFYGESTKRNSNNQIGMLGIGSKSAFAYGDNFVINSFLNGEKHSYNAYIDETQIGQISKMSTEDTDEENGIEIVIAVNESDILEFVSKAKDFYQWFKVKPEIRGVSPFIYDEEFLFEGEGWKWFSKKMINQYDRGTSSLVMGNISYPLDEYALGDFVNENYAKNNCYKTMLCRNLVLYVDIGDVEVSASREKLQYTDYTKDVLKKKIISVYEEVINAVNKEFKDCKTMWDAKCLYGELFDTASNLYSLRNVIASEAKFNGKKISSSNVASYYTSEDGKSDGNVDISFLKTKRRDSGYFVARTTTVEALRKVVLIENDLFKKHSRGIVGRLLPLVLANSKPYLITFKDVSQKEEWIKSSGFDGEFLPLSSFPLKTMKDLGIASNSSSYSGVLKEKDKKHSSSCFIFNYKKLDAWAKKSSQWDIEKINLKDDSGVYVLIDGFLINDQRTSENKISTTVECNRITYLKHTLAKIGISFPTKIYGFKVKERDSVEKLSNWTPLYKWVTQELTKAMDNPVTGQKVVDAISCYAVLSKSDYDSPFNEECIKYFSENVLKKLVKQDGEFASALHAYDTAKIGDNVCASTQSLETIFDLYHFKMPKKYSPSFDFNKIQNAVLEKYSMLKYISQNFRFFDKEKDKKVVSDFVNYINVIDICCPSKEG